MWCIEKDFSFEAAHRLPNHNGKCARYHGHSFKGTLVLEDSQLWTSGSHVGMVEDYGDVSKAIKPILDEYLDHQDLNLTTKLENPTSEELARWVFNMMKERLPLLVAVTIQETCTARCTYRPKPEEI